jgi:hypothetical protein
MSATPATAGASQNGSAEARALSPARPASESAPARSAATDDEILGLATNVRRRGSRGGQAPAPAEAAREARDLDQPELDFALESGRRDGQTANGTSSSAPEMRNAAQNGRDETSNDRAGAAADAVTAAGVAEPAHLRAAFEASPELRAAWHDARAYRETFATPQEARAATGMLADVNRMDALFFSRRPEDHAQLARAVADLDPVAFASLARAMTQVAQTSRVTFPAIAARNASASAGVASRSSAASSSPPVGAQHAVWFHDMGYRLCQDIRYT